MRKLGKEYGIIVPIAMTKNAHAAHYSLFLGALALAAGGYTTGFAEGGWKPVKADEGILVEGSLVVTTRGSIQEYEQSARVNVAMNNWAKYMIQNGETEVMRWAGADNAWMQTAGDK